MNWTSMLVSPLTSIKDVIETIDSSAAQIAIVVDLDNRVLGTITDGDVRRGLLRGIDLSQAAQNVMNASCVMLRPGETLKALMRKHRGKRLRAIPVVGENGELLRVESVDELDRTQTNDHHVILMAGGRGSRLHPMTKDCPKPLLKIGNRPILETILSGFVENGFQNFHFAVNYKGAMIRDYFGDGSRWGVNINYIEEEEELGTAGALSLLATRPNLPFIVMNGDLLTKVNFAQLIDFHIQQGADATMCVREYDFEVPYGVVQIQEESIQRIDEKPIQRFFVNAGIYVLNPSVIDSIRPRTQMHMTSLFEKLVEQKQRTRVFPIREYWLDVGQAADFERAALEFNKAFST